MTPCLLHDPRFAASLTREWQNKDSCYTFIHFHAPGIADEWEDFCKDKLPDDIIYVPPNLEPLNPEHEDEVIPNQHAAFGIQKATQKVKEPAWKDLGLAELMKKGPPNGKAAQMGGYKGMPR
jgi:Apc13p protein